VAHILAEANRMVFSRGRLVMWIIDLWRKLRREKDLEWRKVPPPNVRCSRGGREFW
jgi:hypothetical protein